MFDIREDEEQIEALQKCIECLAENGYFRAGIRSGLSPFDKIVGGMVWAIQRCSQRVEVDLLYSDNQTIGQKIALTEQIVKVLPLLKCPHRLEPHQIQGLDAVHILPVIHWILKEASFFREIHGDEAQNHAIYQFSQQRDWQIEGDEDVGVLPLVKRGRRKVYKRMVRMKHYQEPRENLTDQKPTSSSEDNMDKATQQTPSKEPEMKEPEDLVVLDGDSISQQKQQQTSEGQPSTIPSGLTAQKLTGEELANEYEALCEEEKLLRSKLEEQNQLKQSLGAEIQERDGQWKLLAPHLDSPLFEELKALLQERDDIKAAEHQYKQHCRAELARLDTLIEKTSSAQNDEEKMSTAKSAAEQLDQNIQLEEEKIKDLTAELSKLNRDVIDAERTLEAYPHELELYQYQRRFVELYNLMSTKHRETKRHFTRYNAMQDVRAFTRREIDLLNSIDDARERLNGPSERELYADSFLDSLRQIVRSVDENLSRMLDKRNGLQEQRHQLQNQLQKRMDKQRIFVRTLAEFQAECQRNEELQRNNE